MKASRFFCMAALAAAVFSLPAEEWRFDGAALPQGRLAGGSVIRDGGVAARDPADNKHEAGFRLAKRVVYPEAFLFEAEFTPVVAPGSNGVLWDDMYVNYLPKRDNKGLQIALACANGKWAPRLYFGFGDDTCSVSAPYVALEEGKRAKLEVLYTANRVVVVVLGGKTNVCALTRAGALAPSDRRAPVVGDRYGSCYQPFPGVIHRVAMTSRDRVPFDVHVLGRTAFTRGEKGAKLQVRVENFTTNALADVRLVTDFGAVDVGTLSAQGAHDVAFAVETRFAPGPRKLAATLSAKTKDGAVQTRTTSLSYALGPRVDVRFPVLMWGFAAPAAVLADLGFTHGLDYGLGFNYFESGADDAKRTYAKLDEALAAGVRLAKSVGVRYPQGADEKTFHRRTRTGEISLRKNGKPTPEVSNPALVDAARRLARKNVEAFAPHPAFAGVLPVSERRDETFPSFNTEHLRYQRETGRAVPAEVTGSTFNLAAALKKYPDGVVPDDDPLLAYYRWFWDGGDGWPAYVGAIAEEYRAVSGRYGKDDPRQKEHPFFSFWDPAVRCPPRWGSGGDVDLLNQWIYAVPEPMNVAGPVEEMFAMAAGRPRQQVSIMTQLICYRAQIAPSNVVVSPEPQWVKKLPRAGFPTIPPDTLQEATWSMIAKPVKSVMYHGWGTIYDTGHQTGYCFTNPESTKRLRHLLRDVVAPLGPTLVDLGRAPSPVAVLESATTCFMGGPASWGWSAPAITYLQRARLDPRVVYEQTILRDGLADVKVLYAPQFRFSTPGVVAAIRAFQKRGGIFVADEQCLSALKPDVLAPLVSFAAPPASDHSEDVDAMEAAKAGDVKTRTATMRAKSRMQRQADDLRAHLLAKGYAPALDSSSPEIVTYARRWKDAAYAFAINDKRTFGDYVGAWGRTMEKGLPFAGEVSLADPAGRVKAVYELSQGGAVPFAHKNDKVVVPVSYKTNDGRLFAFLGEKIARLDVAAGDHLAPGGELDVEVRVVGASGNPVAALLPVEVRVYDAKGRELDGAGWQCAKDGVAHVRVLANLDDAPGDYRLVCRDRASGLAVARAIPQKKPGFFQRLFGRR